MRKNTVLKIFGNIVCVILSLFFIIIGVVVPFYYSITALTAPKTIAQVVQNIDYKTVIEESPNIKSTLQNFGIDSSEADKYMKSTKAAELIKVYADETTEIILGIPDNRMLEVSFIRQIVDENIGEFVALAEESSGLNLSEKAIRKNVSNFLDKNETAIEEAIPVIEETRSIVKTIVASTVIERTLTLNFAIIIIAVTALIVTITFVVKRIFGFLWIGIDLFVTSSILSAIIIFSRSYIINRAALKFSRFETEIIESAVSICTEKIMVVLCVMAILAVLFIIYYIVLVLVKRKYKNMYLNGENDSVPEITDEATEE